MWLFTTQGFYSVVEDRDDPRLAPRVRAHARGPRGAGLPGSRARGLRERRRGLLLASPSTARGLARRSGAARPCDRLSELQGGRRRAPGITPRLALLEGVAGIASAWPTLTPLAQIDVLESTDSAETKAEASGPPPRGGGDLPHRRDGGPGPRALRQGRDRLALESALALLRGLRGARQGASWISRSARAFLRETTAPRQHM